MQIAEVCTHLTSGMFGHFTQTNDPLLSILVHASAGKSMLGGSFGCGFLVQDIPSRGSDHASSAFELKQKLKTNYKNQI